MHKPTILTANILCALTSLSIARPLNGFMLARQSNRKGPTGITTLDGIGDDPATAP